jgi:formylglycine-generating enzyme required for sulfatase activity
MAALAECRTWRDVGSRIAIVSRSAIVSRRVVVSESARALLAILSLASMVMAGEPEAGELALLKTFRGEFVELTPGRGQFPANFQMGRDGGGPAEAPQHRVTLSHAFAMARYEVPQDLWQAVMRSNPSRWKGPRNAVEMLSYDEAVEFCRKVTDRLHEAKLIGPLQIVRLPSEAEWEYAARAGTTTLYSFGDDPQPLGDYAWSTHNAAGNDPAVGAKRPNAWQLFDMHGYLWEWCSDIWHASYDGAPADGIAWTTGFTNAGNMGPRVLRGGSWKDPAAKLTSTSRRSAPRELKDDAVGLRCALAEAGAMAAAERWQAAIDQSWPTVHAGLRGDPVLRSLVENLADLNEKLLDAVGRTPHPERSSEFGRSKNS